MWQDLTQAIYNRHNGTLLGLPLQKIEAVKMRPTAISNTSLLNLASKNAMCPAQGSVDVNANTYDIAKMPGHLTNCHAGDIPDPLVVPFSSFPLENIWW